MKIQSQNSPFNICRTLKLSRHYYTFFIRYTSSLAFNFSGNLHINNSREEDQGKYECVAENAVGTEHSKAQLYVKVRRVPPSFSRPPEPLNEVMLGADLNLSCIAVGSPMPHVKWMKDHVDLTPENEVPIGKNILHLKNIQQSANYTCVASSSLAQIEQTASVKVQCNGFSIVYSYTTFLNHNFPNSFACSSNRCLHFRGNRNFCTIGMVLQRTWRLTVLRNPV